VQHGTHGIEVPKRPAAAQKQARHEERARTTDASVAQDAFLPQFVPLPAELRQEGGVLWVASTSCRVGWIAVGLGWTHELSGQHCRIWPSPTGARAVVVTTRRAAALAGRGLLSVRRAGGPEQLVRHTPGFVAADLAWSPDGAVAAACFGTQHGPVVDLLYANRVQTLPGVCTPAFTGSGVLVAAVPSPPRVLVGDRTVLSPAQADALLAAVPAGAKPAVSAVATSGDRIAVTLTAVTPKTYVPVAAALVVVSAGGEQLFSMRLGPQLPSAVGVAPNGSAVWYLNAVDGAAHLVGVRSGPIEEPRGHRYAWSPSGRYLATATGDGVVISEWPDGRRVAALPIAVSDLGWTAAR
jgi:hypothetical protein